MSMSSMAYREVDTIVSKWTNKYQYHISLLESKPEVSRYILPHIDLWSNSA